jgi:hypothetical protein
LWFSILALERGGRCVLLRRSAVRESLIRVIAEVVGFLKAEG